VAPHFSWFMLLPGLNPESSASAFSFLSEAAQKQAFIIPASWLVCAMLILLALAARFGLQRARASGGIAALVPDTSLGPRNVMEIYTSAIWELVASNMSKRDARTYFPLIGTLFIYILVSNLLGLLPGFLPPTDNISTNLAMSLSVFLIFNLAGLRRQGFAYIKHLAGPIWWLIPLFLPLEVVGLCVRPVSLSLRLAGNMFGDHMVFGIMSSLVPPLVPIAFLGLGVFVSFIQALVFSLLSLVYIALALAGEEDHH
jgi:F-type H+-transporting ATPase subunit a